MQAAGVPRLIISLFAFDAWAPSFGRWNENSLLENHEKDMDNTRWANLSKPLANAHASVHT